jgi:uncharacterized delta-60 repeat protein
MKMWRGLGSARVAMPVAMVIFLWVAAPLALAGPGDLDPTFGGDGKVTTDFFAGNDAAKAVAIQKNGKIVAAGTAFNGNTGGNDFALARYKRNGSLDKSFGDQGKVTTHFFAGPHPQFDIGGAANALLIEPDGRIVAAGVAFNGATGASDFALLRYHSDGDLDRHFGNGGMVTTDFGGVRAQATAVALQHDGKLVVVGWTIDSLNNSDFVLARYRTNGRLDASFGSGGKVVTDFTPLDQANAVHLLSDGKILVAGTSACITPPCAARSFVLLRYHTNGSLDTTFGNGGQVTTNFFVASTATAMDVTPDGKIVLAGFTDRGCLACSRFMLARYNPDGSPDISFGDGGVVTTVFGDLITGINRAFAAVIREGSLSQKIVVGGSFQDRAVCGNAGGDVFPCDFALARYNEDGSLDTSFGSGGKVTTDFGGGTVDQAFGLAIQRNGKIVLAGNSDGDFAVARYLAERCRSLPHFLFLPLDEDDDFVCR